MAKKNLRDIESRLGNIAARHVELPHIDSALDQYSLALKQAYEPEELDDMDVEDVVDHAHAFFQDHAKKNPGIAREKPMAQDGQRSPIRAMSGAIDPKYRWKV